MGEQQTAERLTGTTQQQRQQRQQDHYRTTTMQVIECNECRKHAREAGHSELVGNEAFSEAHVHSNTDLGHHYHKLVNHCQLLQVDDANSKRPRQVNTFRNHYDHNILVHWMKWQ